MSDARPHRLSRAVSTVVALVLTGATAARAQTPPVQILPVGDSITAGTGAPAGQSYRSTLWRLLEADGTSFDAVGTLQDLATYRDPDHSGHGGWTISDLNLFLSDTMPPRAPFRPAYILLLIGTNDVYLNRDLANAGTRLTGLLDAIYAFVPEAVVLVGSIPPGRDSAYSTRISQYNARVVTAVNDQVVRGRQAHFVDINAALTVADLTADGIHPNADGYQKIANTWHTALKPLLGATSPSNVPPTISLTAPSSGTVATAPAEFTLTASAADTDGVVSRVDFYAGTTKLGEDLTPPYNVSWSNVAAGIHSVTARAIDDRGAGTTSAPALLTVKSTAVVASAVLNGAASMVVPARSSLNITGHITVEAWIKTTSTAQQGIVERFNSYGVGSINGGYGLRLQGGKLRFFTCKNGAEETGSVTGATTVTLNVWHHVAGVYDGSRVLLYLDGVLDGAAAAVAGPGTGVAETKIGTRGDSTALNRFQGQIDDVRVTAGVVYAGSFTPATRLGAVASTRGLWTFDGRDGVDSSGLGNHLNFSGVTFTSDVPGGAPPPPPPVNKPPSVSLTAPTSTDTFTAPATINLAATAGDSDGTVTKVEFFQGTLKLGEDLTAPHTFAWGSVPAGSYSLTAKATDNGGATTTSSPIAVTVKPANQPPNQPPAVTLTAPSIGASFTAPATVVLEAAASDSDGTVTKVEFFHGATKLGEDVLAPFTYTWSNVTAGNYSLTAVATDDRNATTTSSPAIAVTVNGATAGGGLSAVFNGAAYGVGPVRASLNITGVITVEAWIKTTSTAQQGIVERFNSYGVGSINGGFALRLQDGKLKFFTCKNGAEETGTVVGATPVTLGVWHHVAGVYDGSRVHVYLDGVLDGSAPATAGPGTGAAEIKLGTRGDSVGIARLRGWLDEVRLTAGVVYSGPFVPAARLPAVPGTRGLWTFDAQNGADSSGLGNHLLALSAVTFSSDVPGGVAPNQPPTVNLTAPASNATFMAPAAVTVTAAAGDVDGVVAKVEFFQGATKLGEDQTAPYSFVWTNVAAGSYSLTAVATDSVGAPTTSLPVSITVSPNQVPAVNLTAPTGTDPFTAPATIALAATAADADGSVTKVEFFQGIVKLGEDLAAPYTLSWTSVPAGSYSLTARATDNAGATSTSSPVSITVTPPNQPPTVSLTAPPGGANFTAPATIVLDATASDPDGTVTKVEFFDGATKLGEDTSAPYSFTWTPVAAGSYSLTARAIDDRGASVTSSPSNISVSLTGPPTGTPRKVMPLGDSLTYGIGMQTYGGYRIDLLTKLAAAGIPVDFVGSVVSGPTTMSDRDHEGHFGWDIHEISGSLNTWLDTYKPGMILLMLGTNDILDDLAPPAAALDALIHQIYSRLPFVSMIVSTIPPLSSPKNEQVIAYNAQIPTIVAAHAAQGRDIHAVDIYSVVTVADLVDGIHPGAAAYSRMATVWFDKLIEIGFGTIQPNQPPQVSLTDPLDGASVVAPTTITLAAEAQDDGAIAKVEFYQGTTKLGEDVTHPYTFDWTNLTPGVHTVTAKAIDDSGTSTTSNAAAITVTTASPQAHGSWSGPVTWPLVGIHAHMFPNGKILIFDNSTIKQPHLWDPDANTFTVAPNVNTNLVCSGHAALPDGRMFVAGGHITTWVGPNHTNIFDFLTETWTSAPAMNNGRWYPTVTTLPNGEMLVVSGTIDQGLVNSLPQVWKTAGGWRDLTGAILSLPASPAVYPWMFVSTDGRVFNPGPDQITRYLDPSGTGSWSNGPIRNIGDRGFGSAMMYQPGRVMVVGGGDPPRETAEVIDLTVEQPAWRTVASMAHRRRHANATILPDGKVLVTGGTSGAGFDNPQGPVFAAELWDPSTETWSTMASMQQFRRYHSTALLMPDGRVLTAGSNSVNNAEFYSPPYLFKGPRPTVLSAPASVGYGQSFLVDTPDADSITQVTWIRLPSVTHAFDMNQRFNQLTFSQTAGGLTVTAPANANQSPPGHYMLFILNGSGVPSVAKIVKIE